ncbi:MAG: peptidoglycan DD-metalloendopeptidase family protein [Pseudomonadota bacterium]|nr:peptidoglycan DD-metalloendopeptidase family protein [Pseudomonadota bacterium]
MQHRHRRVAALTGALVAAFGLALTLPAAQPDAAKAEAELKRVTETIQRLQRQVQKDVVEKDRRARALRDSEREAARARGELTRLRAQRAERAAIRKHLETEKAQREAERRRIEEDLAQQLRAAYMMGRNEPLKLLLNQRSPAQASRNLTYYGYLGRVRVGQMDELSENIAKIDEFSTQIEAEDAELAALERQEKDRASALDKALKQRGRALASFEREAGTRQQQLAARRQERKELADLIEKLRQATKSLPYDPKAPFANARGRLSWPVNGRITVNYGASMPTGLKSDGIEIETARGAPVRAIHEGRVIHSDWTKLRGLLVIVDHGNRYWSVYGHLDELHVDVGRKVAAGDSLGTAGVSGGRKDPGLYFQVRYATRADQSFNPVDPRPWFRTPAPPAR